ncbi:hypothetical protein FXO38_04703 [Capsicum annuum]|nr:hypothetical protein FXO38_04703 [Capsicum annuum]KAF3678329.1 hypothetical protein FXO37_04433 [Capsicum annuum]
MGKTELCYYLFLVLVVAELCLQPVAAGSTVKFLPGFQGPLPFELETGYIGVGDHEDAQLFYYFIKSESNPESDPVLLWITGGPGCSALSGLIYEIGKKISRTRCRIVDAIVYTCKRLAVVGRRRGRVGQKEYGVEVITMGMLTNTFEPVEYNGCLPKMILNPYSWTENEMEVKPFNKLKMNYYRTMQSDITRNNMLLNVYSKIHLTFEGEDNYEIPYAYGMGLISYELYEQRIFFYLTTLCLQRFTSENAPEVPEGTSDKEHFVIVEAWKYSDFLCRNYILSGLQDDLYNIYSGTKTSKELWGTLERKYKIEDAGIKKFLVVRFQDFKMIDSKSVVSQVQELQVIIHDLLEEAEQGSHQPKKKFKEKCFNCGKIGHKSTDCRAPKKGKKKDQENMIESNKECNDLCAMFSECNLAGNLREWWMDSGSTCHVCSNKELFSSFAPAQVEEIFYMANSATAKVEGTGKICLKMTSGKVLTLNNVLHEQSSGGSKRPRDEPIENEHNEENPRCSTHQRTSTLFGSDFVTFFLENEPQTFKEAMTSSDSSFWKEAVNSEIDSILSNHTWELVDLPPGNKPLGSKWIFKRKMKVDGTIDKYKARLVVKGFKQKEGKKNKVCKLIKSLYGLKQALKQWHAKFDQTMVLDKFKCMEFNIAKTPLDVSFALRKNEVLEGYSDANWITGSNEVKSTSGYVFTIGGGAVSWKSSKQTCIARSTMESKFIALDKAGEEAEWLRNFLEDIPYCPKPVAPIAWQPEVAAMYSAFEDDKGIVSCFLELHEIAPEPRLKTFPDMLL